MDHFNSKNQDASNLKLLKYKITWDTIKPFTPEKEEVFLQLLKDAKKGKRSVVGKLLKYIAKYPHEETFKNYLFIAYKMQGKDAKALETLQKTIKLHPDYLFGKINLAGEYIVKEEYERVPEIMGEFMELKMLYPERDTFHVTEVMSFFRIATLYFIGIKEWDQAKTRLKMMNEIDPDDVQAKSIAEKLEIAIFAAGLERMKASREKEISVDSYPTVDYKTTDKAPVLNHEILRSFYQYSTDNFPKELIGQILKLPQETLIQDLKLILEDTIRRFDWFYDNYEIYNEEEQEFHVHALYFLVALNAKEGLSIVLNVLRQGEAFLDYWYSDSLNDLFAEPLYLLGESQLTTLKQFVLESHLFSSARLLASQAVAQIVFHQPARRTEVVEWFGEVLQYHLDHPEEEGIIDSMFISWTVQELIDINGSEHEGLIRKLWDKGWIPETLMGNLKEILKELNKPIEEADRDPMPKDVYEFYSDDYLERRVKRIYSAEEQEEMDKIFSEAYNNPMLKKLTDLFSNEFEKEDEDLNNHEKTKYNTQRNTSIKPIFTAKVGRNEPCPCGSGKKYKRCCIS